jgi:hypothetical protein
VQWYAPDALQLPIDEADMREMKMQTGLPYLVACYAQSLHARGWEQNGHANFAVYCRCVMASPHAPNYIKSDPVLQNRFAPYREDLLGPGLLWPRVRRKGKK